MSRLNFIVEKGKCQTLMKPGLRMVSFYFIVYGYILGKDREERFL